MVCLRRTRTTGPASGSGGIRGAYGRGRTVAFPTVIAKHTCADDGAQNAHSLEAVRQRTYALAALGRLPRPPPDPPPSVIRAVCEPARASDSRVTRLSGGGLSGEWARPGGGRPNRWPPRGNNPPGPRAGTLWDGKREVTRQASLSGCISYSFTSDRERTFP